MALFCCTAALLPVALVQAAGGQTSISGTVYSPNGTDPLPNILVYVTTTAVQPLPQGVSSCQAASQLVSGTPLVSTTTDYKGNFTLTNAGLVGPHTVVIQAGKWRRVFTNVVTGVLNANTAVTSQKLSMPQNKSQGDIPQIAVSTGSGDGVECVLRKIGISDTEFTIPVVNGGTGRISLYQGSQSAGITKDVNGTTVPSETALVASAASLDVYDMFIAACQGAKPSTSSAYGVPAYDQNLVDWAGIGGRMFATHYAYGWLNPPPYDSKTGVSLAPDAFTASANWTKDSAITKDITYDAVINQNFQEGAVVANWLQYVGATTTLGRLPINDTDQDQTGVNAPTQSWATLDTTKVDPTSANPVDPSDAVFNGTIMQFTFDTPINPTTSAGISAPFTNMPSSHFGRGDVGDTININITNSSAQDADTSLNLAVSLPAGLTATALAGANAITGWACSVATLTCNRTVPLTAGASDPVLLTVNVAANAPGGAANIIATVGGGGLASSQCGRVLFNEYHVEDNGGKGGTFPTECTTTAMTPQEKFLEFNLYNLSNFVSPQFTDVITIQSTPVITWPTPASIPYGTPLSATQLDATATDATTGATVAGSFVYNPSAATVLDAGSDTLNTTFTPTDTTTYSTATASVTLIVTQDGTTTSVVSSLNPSTYGQSVMFTATVVGSNAGPTGTVSFYDGSTLLGTGNLTVVGGSVSTATYSTNALVVGSHGITAVYGTTTDFTTSTSPVLTQVVNKAKPTIVWPTPASVPYGTTLSGTQLNATASDPTTGVALAGTFNYTPAAGSTPNTGSDTLNVTFTPSDATDYSTATANVTLVVTQDTTTIAVVSNVNPSGFGQSVTFTATVTGSNASPGGMVTFLDNGAVLGTGTLTAGPNNTATATYTTSTLAGGSHPITVQYTATTNFATSSSPVLTQVVGKAVPTITWATPASIPYGTTLSGTQLNATAADPSTGVALAGTFVYTPVAGSTPSAGSDTLSVTFTPSDSTDYSTATASVTLVVTRDTTTASITSNLNPSQPTQAVTFTATLVGSNASPTGSVSFYDGATLLGTGTLTAGAGNSATATYTTSTLAVGSHPITAVYVTTTNFNGASSLTLTQVVNKTTPTITWPTPASIAYGTALSGTQLNATATNPISGATVAGTFMYTPSAGTVLDAGTKTLNVTFTPTDSTDYSTATASVMLVVTQDTTTSAVVSSMNPSLPGQSVTFTATETGSNASPSGSVSFYDGTTLLGTSPLAAGAGNTATGTYTTTTLAVGSHPITAVFMATTDFGGSSSAVLTQVVGKSTPVITWNNPAPVPYGTALSGTQLNATATNSLSGATVPGTFVYTPAAGAVPTTGSDTLSVTFTPTDPTVYNNASASVTLVVTRDSTTASVSSSLNPSFPTQSVTFTGTLTGSNASPTGTISFYDGATLLGTSALTAGPGNTATGTYTTTALAAGSHPIIVVYTATTNFGGASSPVLTQVVKQSTPVINWPTPASIAYGTPLSGTQLDATASNAQTGATVAGTFVYTPAAGTVLNTGNNTLNVTFTPTDTAMYTTAAASVTLVVTGQTTTTSTVSSSLDPSNVGQSVTFTATVTGSSSSPTGTISFYEGTTLLGTGTLTAGAGNSATATYATSTLAVGTHPITAVFVATANFGASNSSAALNQIVKALVPVLAWPTPANINVGTALSSTQLDATATDPSTGAAVAGTFAYTPSAGTVLAVGTTTLNATFMPADPSKYSSGTVTTTITVVGVPGYTITVTPATMDAPIGANTPISVNVASVYGYNVPIVLTCSGLPVEATCSFSQSTVTGSATVTLLLTPGAPHDCGVNNPYFVASGRTGGYVWMSAAGLCLLLVRRRKKLLRALVVVAGLCLLPVIQGCGSGCTDFGTKPGTYSFTITATPATAGTTDATRTQSKTVTFNATL